MFFFPLQIFHQAWWNGRNWDSVLPREPWGQVPLPKDSAQHRWPAHAPTPLLCRQHRSTLLSSMFLLKADRLPDSFRDQSYSASLVPASWSLLSRKVLKRQNRGMVTPLSGAQESAAEKSEHLMCKAEPRVGPLSQVQLPRCWQNRRKLMKTWCMVALGKPLGWHWWVELLDKLTDRYRRAQLSSSGREPNTPRLSSLPILLG